MKKHLPLDFQKTRAFTLIELVVTIFIASLVLATFYTILSFSSKTLMKQVENNDEAISIIYMLSSIENEIKRSDQIYQSEGCIANEKYSKDTLGFILEFIEEKKEENRLNYKYVWYALAERKLYRCTYDAGSKRIYETKIAGDGFNALGEVSSIEGSKYDDKNKLSILSITIPDSSGDKTYTTAVFAGIKRSFK